MEAGGGDGGDQVILFMASEGQARGVQSLSNDHPSNNATTRSTTLRKRPPLRRLSMSKPRARNVEFNLRPRVSVLGGSDTDPNNLNSDSVIYEEDEKGYVNNNNNNNNPSSTSDFSSDDDEEEEEDELGSTYHKIMKKKKKKINCKRVVEWSLFLIILTCLILSLTVSSLKNHLALGLKTWQWSIIMMVVISGRLCSGWVVSFMVFLIERNFMLREKVLYFVYGLRRSIQNCVWLGLVLLAWTCVFNAQVHKKNKVVKKVSQFLIAVLIGATIWLIKIVLVKTLASSFHVRTYFDRMKESVFHHYILDSLSGQPMDEGTMWEEEHKNAMKKGSKSLPAKWKQEARMAYKSKKYGTRKLDLEKLKKLSMERSASAWSMKRIMKYIRTSGLSTISKTVDEFGNAADSEITSEWEARSTAKRIFRNVAKRGAKYIEEEDLGRFLKRNEIHAIFPLFEGALETGRISKSSFRNWVVRAYFERKALAHSLNDTKTAVQQLHKLASAIVSVVILVVAILVMGLATPKVVGLVITQMLVLGFIFHNSCKTIFECIIFVFVMHPFDIGDRCKIDGVQMIVEEMNILSTVFLRYDMEKIYYPNSALLNKPISNFYRSPEMGDAVPFNIDASTPIDTINSLKKSIQSYIDSKPNYWNTKHSIVIKDFEDLSTLKMSLCVQHTINHQNFGERSARLTELILEMKKIFENLGIKYHLPPQQVHLTQPNVVDSSILPVSTST